MEISSEANKTIEESQILEQHLTEFLAQKQSIQIELQEISNALEELGKTNDDVYKILGGIMIKSDKGVLSKELEERKKLMQLRISSIEKQERIIEDKIFKLKDKIRDLVEKNKKKREIS